MSTDPENREDVTPELDESQQPLIADTEQKDNVLRDQIIGGCSLIVFTVLQVVKPVLVRVAHKEAEKYGITFIGSTTVFFTELFKALFCFIIVLANERSIKKLLVMIYESFTVNKYETLKLCLPALIFVIQNNLFYFALQRIDATLFSVTYQLQILTTAILMIIILDKRFTRLQWLALVMSLVGVVTVQFGVSHEHTSSKSSVNLGVSDTVAGLIAVLIMCMTTAFGCVYMEAVLKKSQADIFLQNIRLSIVSLPMTAVTICVDHVTVREHGFFTGWNEYVWIVVLINAFAAIVVSSVIRYADNIKKSFCQALALGATAFVAIWLGDSRFSFFLVLGVAFVVTSVILYAASSPQNSNNQEESTQKDLDENLLDRSAQLA